MDLYSHIRAHSMLRCFFALTYVLVHALAALVLLALRCWHMAATFDREVAVKFAWVYGYPNIPESTLYDPEFHVDSKSAVKITVTTRNHELQPPIGTAGQAHQLDIPTRPDQTVPIFDLAIEF